MEACLDRSGSWPIRNLQDAQHFDIDWMAIERDYCAGQLSLRDMASKHGCSHSAIANRAGRHHWIRAHAISTPARFAGSDLHGRIGQPTAPARPCQALKENIE